MKAQIKQPLVSILLASYNGEKFIAEQIESLQKQTHQNWELIISDDGSNDGTLNIIRELIDSDSRIKLVHNETMHMGSTRNFLSLLGEATSEYVMFCDQDDIWLPEKIQITLRAMQEREARYPEKPIAVYTDLIVVDENLNEISGSFEAYQGLNPSRTSIYQLLAQNTACGCTMLLNRNLVNQLRVLNYAEIENIPFHDWLAVLIAAAFGQVAYLNSATMLYRQHQQNAVGASRFNLVNRFKHQDDSQQWYRKSIQQAATFLDIYQDELSRKQREKIGAFASLLTEQSSFKGFYLLFKSGCWRSGTRKASQLIMTRRLLRDNRLLANSVQ